MGVRVAGDGHSHDHHVDSYDALEVRGRVLGLAWYSGKISLDLSLIADPELAGEVFLSEAAHMVDFFYMTSAHRVAVWNAAHLDDPPLPLDFEPPEDGTAWHHDHGWFDVGTYRHFVGEAFDADVHIGCDLSGCTRWHLRQRVNLPPRDPPRWFPFSYHR